jgi:glycolate oxidase
VVTRGAGTGLSGGAMPLEESVVLGLSKLNRIKSIDAEKLFILFSDTTSGANVYLCSQYKFYFLFQKNTFCCCLVNFLCV